jgi:amino-acid N-acetyltransferase
MVRQVLDGQSIVSTRQEMIMESLYDSTDDQPARAGRRGGVAVKDTARTIRAARAEEIHDILALFEDEVRAGRMLPRDPAEMAEGIGDWLVAVEEGEVTGCVSLVFFGDELCELRSLAVRADHRGNGLGGKLIRAAVEMARVRGMRRVLTLTRAVGVFESAGFVRDLVGNYPEKVWRDCMSCPLRARCDEVALVYDTPAGAGV